MISQTTQLVSAREAARALGISSTAGDRIIKSGLGGHVYETQSNLLVLADKVANLVELEMIDPSHSLTPRALVFRADAATVGTPGRRQEYQGWNEALTESQKIEAISKWHRIKNPSVYIGSPLVVTVSSIVVLSRTITGANSNHFEWTEFQLAPENTTIAGAVGAEFFRGKRLKTGKGGPIVRIGDWSDDG